MNPRIEINPNVHFGKPCVTGTRITVENVLELVNDGIEFKKIISDFYPVLSEEDIRACIHYAIDVLNAEELHVAVPV
jgi:uncharacterized protein (DUF433 family)